MRVLQLSKKFPFPLKDGEAIAITYLAKAMNQLGVELDLLSMNTHKHFFEIKQLPANFDHYHKIELVNIDTRIKLKNALLNLFSNKSYHIERFVSKSFENKLIELLQAKNYDIVQLETLYLAPYIKTIRKYSKARIAMRAHNVEHEIWERITKNVTLGIKKWYLNLLTRRLKNFEISCLNTYDMMIPITKRDAQCFQYLGMTIPLHTAPIGLELENYPAVPLKIENTPTFSFIGSLDWMPNIEGIRWLLDEVWPIVLEQAPNAQFHIAGRNAPDWLLKLNLPGITVHGEVPNAKHFITSYDIMLVPLLSGSGMRVKILEGMALQRLIISTKIGLEGIHAKQKKEVLIADNAQEFAQQILYAYRQPQQVERMAAEARIFIQKYYDNKQIAKKLVTYYSV